MRQIVITADDFGFDEAVNEAVERGCREGVLRAASLMVSAPASADAVARARRLPQLRVGLHLTLVRGQPTLPPARIPHLVDSVGQFPDDLLKAAVRWFFLPAARRELALEVAAQFAAFHATGLVLDHVNVHNHLQFHPSVLSEIMRNLAGDGQVSVPVRVPREPLAQAGATAALLAPWVALLRWRLRRAGLRYNDWLLGVRDSGQINEQRLLDLLAALPSGAVEIHLHPAVERTAAVAAAMPGYANDAEFAALISPRVAARMAAAGLCPGGFRDLLPVPD